MALMSGKSGVGRLDAYTEPQVWLAVSFRQRDQVAMKKSDWDRLDNFIKNKVLDHDVPAFVGSDPNKVIPDIQKEVRACILQAGLEPDNVTFAVVRVSVREGRFWRTETDSEVGRLALYMRDIPAVGDISAILVGGL